MKKVILIAVVFVFAVMAFAGCAQAPAQSGADNSLQTIKDKGEIVMGLDDKFPPMGFRDENGDLAGFDIDLANAVAKELGVNLKLQPIDWKAKEVELAAGNIDVIWNGYTITDDRKEKVLMSPPYMANAQVVLVKTESPIKAFADLAGKKVGVQEGSSAQDALNAKKELVDSFSETIGYKDNVIALMDVDSSQIDALAVDLVVAEYYMSQRPDEFRMLEEQLAPEEYGIGFRKGEQAFHDAVVAAIAKMQKDGKTAEISNVWFGKDVTLPMA